MGGERKREGKAHFVVDYGDVAVGEGEAFKHTARRVHSAQPGGLVHLAAAVQFKRLHPLKSRIAPHPKIRQLAFQS
jgi:hypothetical protein